VVDGINIIRQARPDLFIGSLGTSYTTIAIDTAIPVLPDQFFLPLAMFVGAMVESQDDTTSDRARGEMLTKIAGGLL
jgi:hypothetical protein